MSILQSELNVEACRKILDRLDVSYVPSQLLGREMEKRELSNYLAKKFNVDGNEGGGGVYFVVGVPGTGKSALLSQVLQDKFLNDLAVKVCPKIDSKSSLPEAHIDVRVVKMNAMRLNGIESVFDIFRAQGLLPPRSGSRFKDFTTKVRFQKMQKWNFERTQKTLFLVLAVDEIDDSLYTVGHQRKLKTFMDDLMSICRPPNSNCVLFGIGNKPEVTADLASWNEDHFLRFSSYDATQLKIILFQRVFDISEPVFLEHLVSSKRSESESGMKFSTSYSLLKKSMERCAVQCAGDGGNGDARRAIEHMRTTIETALSAKEHEESSLTGKRMRIIVEKEENEAKKQKTSTTVNIPSLSMSRVASPVAQIENLPPNARLLLRYLLSSTTNGKSAQWMKIEVIRKNINAICKKHALHPPNQQELLALIDHCAEFVELKKDQGNSKILVRVKVIPGEVLPHLKQFDTYVTQVHAT